MRGESSQSSSLIRYLEARSGPRPPDEKARLCLEGFFFVPCCLRNPKRIFCKKGTCEAGLSKGRRSVYNGMLRRPGKPSKSAGGTIVTTKRLKSTAGSFYRPELRVLKVPYYTCVCCGSGGWIILST